MTEELTRKAKILDADRIRRMVDRMAHEIAERQKDLPGLALIGIRTRGVPLAVRLADWRVERRTGAHENGGPALKSEQAKIA